MTWLPPPTRSLRAALAAVAVVVVATAGGARAAPDPVALPAQRVEALEAERARLLARRDALEGQSRREAAEIDQLKAGGALGREVRLPQLLASARQRADELSSLASTLREREGRLVEARRALVELCRAALADPGLPPDRRVAVARTEAEALRALEAAARGAEVAQLKVAPPAAIDPLAGPAELIDRADRLRDDEEKLRREAARLALRIDRIEERRRLRERAAELGDDLFVEGAVGRRAIRSAPPASSMTTPQAGGAKADLAAPPAISPGGLGGFGGAAAEAPTIALRGVVDPSTLDDLRRAEAGADVDGELGALRRARLDLEARAQGLERREAELRQRAALLRGTK